MSAERWMYLVVTSDGHGVHARGREMPLDDADRVADELRPRWPDVEVERVETDAVTGGKRYWLRRGRTGDWTPQDAERERRRAREEQ